MLRVSNKKREGWLIALLVAHDCGYPLSRYTCRATRVAADFLDFIAFCRCSTGVALHPLKILVSHPPPPCAGRCRTEIWLSEKVSRYTGVSQLQLWVSRYTVQLSPPKSLVSLGFEGRTELFGPHPFKWKTPTPPEDTRTKKFGFGFLFLA